MNVMCNLSQGIREEATRVATEATIREMIISMYEEGLNIEQIAKIAKKNIEEVKAVIEKMRMVLV